MKHFKTLKNFLLKHKKRYILGIMWLLIVDILQLVFPQILKAITDSLQSNELSLRELLNYSLL